MRCNLPEMAPQMETLVLFTHCLRSPGDLLTRWQRGTSWQSARCRPSLAWQSRGKCTLQTLAWQFCGKCTLQTELAVAISRKMHAADPRLAICRKVHAAHRARLAILRKVHDADPRLAISRKVHAALDLRGNLPGKTVDFGNPLCVATKLAIHCIDCQGGVLFDGNAQGLLVGVGQFGIECQISMRFT